MAFTSKNQAIWKQYFRYNVATVKEQKEEEKELLSAVSKELTIFILRYMAALQKWR